MSDTKAPTQTYKASCHCGAFAYTVKTPSLDHESTEVVRCNCSICMRNGYLFVYVPNDEVTFTSGQLEGLTVLNPPCCLHDQTAPTMSQRTNPVTELRIRNPICGALLLPHLRQLVHGA